MGRLECRALYTTQLSLHCASYPPYKRVMISATFRFHLANDIQSTINVTYEDYDSQPMSTAKNMYQLLQAAATTRSAITTYPTGNLSSSIYTSYTDLLQVADANAYLIQTIREITPDSVVSLHFGNQLDSIIWCWALIIAGYLPTISIPLTNGLDQYRSTSKVSKLSYTIPSS